MYHQWIGRIVDPDGNQEGVLGTFYNSKRPIAGDFLAHSLQDRPPNMRLGDGTAVAKALRATSEFQAKVREIVNEKHPSWFPNASGSEGHVPVTTDSDPDLAAALHEITLYYRFRDTCTLELAVTDKYDFDFEWSNFLRGKPGWGVNRAALDQAAGVIQRYWVLVKMDVSPVEYGE